MAIRSGRFGYSFTAIRILQFFCFAAISGLCAFFAAEVNRLDGPHQPAPVSLALAISVVTATYSVITLFGHLCHPLPYIANTIGDAIATVVLIITTLLVGIPLTRLDCAVVGDNNEHIESLGDVLFSVNGSVPDGIHNFVVNAKDKFQRISGVKGMESVDGLRALGGTADEIRSKLGDYPQWIGRVGRYCSMMKGVWGLLILLVFLFAATATISFILYRRVHSIRTFHVEENEDGTHTYHTEYAQAPIMREDSVRSNARTMSITSEERTSADLLREEPKPIATSGLSDTSHRQ